jgi:Site-specific recombinases, DNA invertase Pin homologs
MNEDKVVVIKGDPTIAKKKILAAEGRKLRVAAYCRVSTLNDEQVDSFKSQVAYYTGMIASNPDWENAGIYADEGISGTQAEKRPQFLKMVAAAMNGQIDIILVKSLSRFGRNTVDNLNYVRAFREKNVAIHFEEEGIDTSKEGGEIMITILSSCAQQEVQNTSEHVKTGLKMIMSRGDLIGNAGCLGYDYDKTSKSIKVNSTEAKTIRYIFDRYIQGAGTTILARELEQMGYKTKDGGTHWFDSTILGIIKNEKYKGDLVQGKTFTVDPITKRRLRNFGEADKYCMENHHEAIVTPEVFDEANRILSQRSYCRRLPNDGTRIRLSRAYTFSTMLECGFCHSVLVRRRWCGGANGPIPIWQCVRYSKKGKENCPYSKAIPEHVIQEAFVDVYNAVVSGNSVVVDEFLSASQETIGKNDLPLQKKSNQRRLEESKEKQDKLVGLYINGTITEEAYQKQFATLSKESKKLLEEKDKIGYAEQAMAEESARIEGFKKAVTLNGKSPLKEFDPSIFETCIEKVIIGSDENKDEPDPYAMTFVFKNSFCGSVGKSSNEDSSKKSCQPVIIATLSHFWRHCLFVQSGKHERQKRIRDFLAVKAIVINEEN